MPAGCLHCCYNTTRPVVCTASHSSCYQYQLTMGSNTIQTCCLKSKVRSRRMTCFLLSGSFSDNIRRIRCSRAAALLMVSLLRMTCGQTGATCISSNRLGLQLHTIPKCTSFLGCIKAWASCGQCCPQTLVHGPTGTQQRKVCCWCFDTSCIWSHWYISNPP